jgi:very-short-patch-repair endonuclease
VQFSANFAAPLTSDPLFEPSLGVRASQSDVQRILATEGVIARRDHPILIGTIDRLVRNDSLRAVLPGVYAPPELCDSIATRVRALMHWDPDAILVDEAAAWASFWPEIRVPRITCTVHHRRLPQSGYEFKRRRIPSELVTHRSGLRFTSPALTALDLCATVGGDAIDQALRTRATTLAHLHQAMELTAARVGNRTRRQLLLDSRSEPWSEAERRFHRLLRQAGITGWKANRPVVLDDATCYVDVIFYNVKLIIEIDGRLFHTGAEVFETDRWRQNLLVLNGWLVLRFTWSMIEERPEQVIAIVCEAIEMLMARNA